MVLLDGVGKGVVEVSCRAIGSRFLLRPSDEANDLLTGTWVSRT